MEVYGSNCRVCTNLNITTNRIKGNNVKIGKYYYCETHKNVGLSKNNNSYLPENQQKEKKEKETYGKRR